MTHKPIQTLPDGTRLYASGHRYKPVADADRVYKRRRPDDPRAVTFNGRWFLPLEVLSDEERTMPLTRPDEQTLEHGMLCRCEVCLRPAAAELWRKYRRRVLGIAR